VKQAELDEILDLLVAGGAVDGWGHTLHMDFSSLFNAAGDLWIKDCDTATWKCEPLPSRQRLLLH
jgi:hypothetical protein